MQLINSHTQNDPTSQEAVCFVRNSINAMQVLALQGKSCICFLWLSNEDTKNYVFINF